MAQESALPSGFQEAELAALLELLIEEHQVLGEGPEVPSAKWLMETYDGGRRHSCVPRADVVEFLHFGLFMAFAHRELGEIQAAKREAASQAAHEAAIRRRTFLLPAQRLVKEMYEHPIAQFVVATVILANFFVCAVDAQLQPEPGTLAARSLFGIQLGITIFFIIELLVNMYGHFFLPFWKDPWNVFDVVVVASSIAAWFGRGIPALSALRLLRAFRVLRLFKFFPSIASLVERIFNALGPVSYALLLLILTMFIWAIMGVSLLGDRWPEFYGSFCLACLSQLQILTFDSWVSQLMRPIIEKDGIHMSLFFLSYVFINAAVMLNIVASVFISQFKEPLPLDDDDEPTDQSDIAAAWNEDARGGAHSMQKAGKV